MYPIAITITALAFFLLLILILIKTGYTEKLLFKLGLMPPKPRNNWTAVAWNNCLKKYDCSADIAFFGDSLTYGSDFHKCFKDKKIVNLGCGGDTIQDLINRTYLIKTVEPKKIFLLCGINGLTDLNIKKSAEKYEELIRKIKEIAPEAELYIQSVLPISKSKERSICHNLSIIKFNTQIEDLAKKYSATYIDLHPSFFVNNELNPEFTKDGLHLLPPAFVTWKNIIEKYI